MSSNIFEYFDDVIEIFDTHGTAYTRIAIELTAFISSIVIEYFDDMFEYIR